MEVAYKFPSNLARSFSDTLGVFRVGFGFGFAAWRQLANPNPNPNINRNLNPKVLKLQLRVLPCGINQPYFHYNRTTFATFLNAVTPSPYFLPIQLFLGRL